MPSVKDHAHVLRVYEHTNSSQIIVFLGRRYGAFRVLAKGSRRMSKRGFEGGFDLLSRGEILAYPRPDDGLWIFKEWEERWSPKHLGSNLTALRAASYLAELSEQLTRETAGLADPDVISDTARANAALYRQLGLTAKSLDAQAKETPFLPGAQLLEFTLHGLALSGWLPDLERCSACSKVLRTTRQPVLLGPDGLECNNCGKIRLAENGVIGPDRLLPVHSIWLPQEALSALQFVYKTGKSARVTPNAATALARALERLVHNGLERDLRTLKSAMREVYRMGKKEK